MCNGWIKLHRKILDWEWYDDTNVVRLFLHFLLTANTKDNRWHGIEIKRGQLIVTSEDINEKLHLTRQQYRTALTKLKSTNEITIKTTNRFTLITLCKYETYQRLENQEQPTNQPTEQPTGNQQITNKQPHYKNNKNIRNKEVIKEDIFTNVHISKKDATEVAPIKTIEERKESFRESLRQYIPIYGEQMIREFYDYWSESSENARKFRKEKQTTWDTSKRLARWQKNQRNYGNNNRASATSAREQRDAEWQAYAMQRLYNADNESDEIPFPIRDG